MVSTLSGLNIKNKGNGSGGGRNGRMLGMSLKQTLMRSLQRDESRQYIETDDKLNLTHDQDSMENSRLKKENKRSPF
jgi:hypothetical protein